MSTYTPFLLELWDVGIIYRQTEKKGVRPLRRRAREQVGASRSKALAGAADEGCEVLVFAEK